MDDVVSWNLPVSIDLSPGPKKNSNYLPDRMRRSRKRELKGSHRPYEARRAVQPTTFFKEDFYS